MLQMLTNFQIKDMTVRNRITLPPMCMYCASEDGMPNESHLVHYVSRAVGGTGLIIMEATAVVPRGRISDHCLGLWNDGQAQAIGKIVKACQARGAKMAIQLNHAGRKCAAKAEPYIHAPSPIAFSDEYQTPREITVAELDEVVEAFRAAAKRAYAIGFDAIEIHAAHGYLISEFLSPLTNQRTDAYGGRLENRCRLLERVLQAVRQEWPAEKPLLVRVSAEDYLEGGIHPAEMVEIVNRIMKECFPSIVDPTFTANLEYLLDKVGDGELPWKSVVRNFYPDLMDAVKKAEKELETVTISDEVSDEVCDQCGRNMVIKYGPHGKFLACPGFPECKNTKPYLEKIGVPCPKCGKEVVRKKTKKGRLYYGCEANPDCDFMSWQKPSTEKCPKCGSYMVEKGNKLLCSNQTCGYRMNLEKEEKEA